MSSKLIVAFAVFAGTFGVLSTAYGQSPKAPESNREGYTINGGSLTGIDNRTAENDYARFFSEKNSGNNSRANVQVAPTGVIPLGERVELRRSETLTTPNNVIFDGREAVEVQVTPR
ncbi:hypothetical protein NUACC21_72050 [Scytonema sp. NUACC21]